LEEYWAKKGIKTESNQVDPNIKKKMEEELTKELLAKKATPLISKKKSETSESQVKLESNHFVQLNSAHSDLLNFRTGFVEREYKERTKDGERPPQRERKEYPKREEKTEKTEKTEEGQEGEKVEEGGEESPSDKKGDAPRKQYSKGGYKGNKPSGTRTYNNNPKGGSSQPKIDLGDDAFPKLG